MKKTKSTSPKLTIRHAPGHSPLPWAARYDEHDEELLIENDSFTVARVGEWSGVPTPEDNANAAFIAQACNSHADLVAACEAVMIWAKTPGNHGGVNPYTLDFVKQAESAIANAQGGGK